MQTAEKASLLILEPVPPEDSIRRDELVFPGPAQHTPATRFPPDLAPSITAGLVRGAPPGAPPDPNAPGLSLLDGEVVQRFADGCADKASKLDSGPMPQ